MELRLRELENDLEDRLESYEEAAGEAEESNEDVYERLDELEESFEAQDKSIGKFNDTCAAACIPRSQESKDAILWSDPLGLLGHSLELMMTSISIRSQRC